ncbi:hypothetical protein FVEN_g9461 [Fusarium venenatum]|uniref:Uncharacterized protein n=1 Tax=Fusarium venenatum TaxID=56646 RepID=A0A2L2TEK8_9HYPO|nr:uncharacterized protein FVRRES_05882 [Fusarium venenatum]KAG8352675.1 hypothetical protein FVEN_g9461 [Fusarium venenatum]CEI61446.1 unnamed protein product [Fusarium venenatum]
MPRNYVTIVMVRKNDASASTDQQIMKLGETLAKNCVEINITPTKLQLVLLNGRPDKGVKNYAAAHLRVQVEKKTSSGSGSPPNRVIRCESDRGP